MKSTQNNWEESFREDFYWLWPTIEPNDKKDEKNAEIFEHILKNRAESIVQFIRSVEEEAQERGGKEMLEYLLKIMRPGDTAISRELIENILLQSLNK